ncbi:MAG: hypothetical protein WA885_13460 [Phormidesmis sp.]
MSLQSLTLTSLSIPFLLNWWQQRKRTASLGNLQATLPRGDETYLQAYYRLMEVYSVVKSGGVTAQIEAVNALTRRESALLNQQLAQIETHTELSESERHRERQKVEQELNEMTSANKWRIQTLSAIAPEEEAVVRQYLSDIEKTLMPSKCA